MLSRGVMMVGSLRGFKRNQKIINQQVANYSSASPNAFNRNLGTFISSVLTIGVFGLGCWQVQRYNWKVNLIEEMKESKGIAPVIVKENDMLSSMSKDTVVMVEGAFDHKREVLLGPRSSPLGLYEAAQGMATNPQGFYILVPFIRSNGETVFINRGWVPKDRTKWSRPEGKVTVSCIISEPEKAGRFSPVNAPASGKLLWVERPALLAAAEMSADTPFSMLEVIDMQGSSNIAKSDDDTDSSQNKSKKKTNKQRFPAPRTLEHLHELHVMPITHAAYAVTWFALAASGVVLTYVVFRGGRSSIFTSKRVRKAAQPKV